VFGDGELAPRLAQGVTVPCGHRQAALGIEVERGGALEHGFQIRKYTFHHLIALFSTLSGNQASASSWSEFFSMKSTTYGGF
jgi:hypothetical protein